MTQAEQRKRETAAAVEELGGARFAPLVVFHYIEIGARVAESMTAEDIAEQVAKQQQEEKEAESRGMVCLTSAEFVGFLLEKVQTLAKMPALVRVRIIKKYL